MMTDEDVTIHVFLDNSPKEYNNIVEMMEIKLMNTTNLMMLTIVRERLWSKYERLKKSGVIKKKNDEETALALNSFLGQCYVCGEFSHKGEDFPDKEKRG